LHQSSHQLFRSLNSAPNLVDLSLHPVGGVHQVTRLEQVFELFEMAPKGKKCHGIEGLLEEAEIMSEAEDREVRDAGMLAAAWSVEHYDTPATGR
jgi:ferritin-like metal-binding protein YciE